MMMYCSEGLNRTSRVVRSHQVSYVLHTVLLDRRHQILHKLVAVIHLKLSPLEGICGEEIFQCLSVWVSNIWYVVVILNFLRKWLWRQQERMPKKISQISMNRNKI